MTDTNITIEMLYELMLDQKREMADVKNDLRTFKYEVTKRFDLVDMHFNLIDQKLAQNDKQFSKIEELQTQEHKILTELWENRKDMKLSLTNTLLTVTGLTSGVIAFVVSLLTGKAITFRN